MGLTYLWSEFPNPLGYWLIHHNFHFASIFLFGDGKLQVISRQEGRAALHHSDPTVHADEGGAGPAQEQQQQGGQPTPAHGAHADRASSLPSTGEIPSTRRASVLLPGVSAHSPSDRARGPDNVPQVPNMLLSLQTQTRRPFRQSQRF